MHFSLIRSRPELVRAYGSVEEALANPSNLTLCDGPLLTDGMCKYIVGRVIGFLEGH
jgi:hypothetical protein